MKHIRTTRLVDRLIAAVFFMAVFSGVAYLSYLMLSLIFWSFPVFAALFVVGAGLIALVADEVTLDFDGPRIRIHTLPEPGEEDD